MGAKPPGRSPTNYVKGDNCLHCWADGLTPKYIQGVVTGMEWNVPRPPFFDGVVLPNGIPMVMVQNSAPLGGPDPGPCTYGAFMKSSVSPISEWVMQYVAWDGLQGSFELALPGFATFFQGAAPLAGCKKLWTNSILWPVHGGTGYVEWNQSVNAQRKADQANYQTTDRPSVVLRDHKFLDESKNRYEQQFYEDGTSALALRNRRYGMSIQVHWDEKEYQDSL